MRNRTPRKDKIKINRLTSKRGILVYDLASLPTGMTLKNVLFQFYNYGIVTYNSKANGNMSGINVDNPPYVINPKSKIKIIDNSCTNPINS